MRRGIHCPRCGELLVALTDVDLFIVLRQHIDAEQLSKQLDDDELQKFVTLLAHDVL